MKKYEKQLLKLINTIKSTGHNKTEIVEEAFWFAEKAHRKQKRKSGDPYFIHPLNVAQSIAETGMNETTVAAALLHDTVEDTEVCESDIKTKFGKEVCDLIRGVTKFKTAQLKKEQEKKTANILKTIIASSKDLRIIIIKLFDKLHNLKTIKYLDREKQKKIATEVLSIYVPLSHQLGMHKIKYELEDLAFKTTEPKVYKELKKKIHGKKQKKEEEINAVIKKLKSQFPNEKWRMEKKEKSIYNLHAKMVNQSKELNELTDFLILKIIVKNREECYSALGKVHSTYKPIPQKIKDYIALPEYGIYQSLHTQVIDDKKKLLKIYIFSEEMEKIGDYGIIHYIKNGNGKEFVTKYKKIFKQLKKPEIQNTKQIVDKLNLDFQHQTTIVFTAKGELINLPIYASALDFAYFLNDKKAHKAAKAIINEKIVPLWTQIKSGDRIKILYSTTSKINPAWISFANTQKARTAIEKKLSTTEIPKNKAIAKFKIDAVDRQGLLQEQTKVMAESGLDMEITLCKMYPDNITCFTEFFVRNNKIGKINSAIIKLKKMEETLNVTVEYFN